MKINNFKKSLFFKQNEYFEEYITLINNNINTEPVKGKTEVHHVIPLVMYIIDSSNLISRKEAEKISEADGLNFTVNLYYKDHILAHYYLALCCLEKYQSSLVKAFSLMTFNNYKFIDQIDKINFINNLDQYQMLYEDFTVRMAEQRTNKKLSIETRKKISQALTGKKKSFSADHCRTLKAARDFHSTTTGKRSIYNKDLDKVKFVFEKDLPKYLSNNWVLGGRPLSKEAKEKIGRSNSSALKGKIKIKNSGLAGNKVLCIEENLIFNSIKEAQTWLFNKTGITGSQIKNVCAGKREQTGGYHWKYIT